MLLLIGLWKKIRISNNNHNNKHSNNSNRGKTNHSF